MYKATIQEVYADHELTAKERIQFKDTTNCTKLDEATQQGDVLIDPVMWGVLRIHNDKSDSGDYENYVIIDKEGARYITGSNSFWRSFTDILDEMQGVEEPWSVRAYRMPSKNYKGKDFITCSVV